MPAGGFRSGFLLDSSSLKLGLKAVQVEYARRANKAIKKGALFYVAEIKKELSQPGTGRARRTGRKKTRQGIRILSSRNRASAPGQPPAVDTGRLRASITHVVKREFLTWIADVGSNVEYAAILEFGGHTGRNHATFIQARPYMLTTLARIRPQLVAIFAKVLVFG